MQAKKSFKIKTFQSLPENVLPDAKGGKDSLVNPKTVDEFEKVAPNAWLKIKALPNETHFVLWEKPQVIVDAIKDMSCALSP